MNIALVTPSYFPDSSGGAGISSYLIAHALESAGVNVDIYACIGDQKECREKSSGLYTLPAGTEYIPNRWPEILGENVSVFFNLPDMSHYDVLHNYSPGHAPATTIKSDIPVLTSVNGYPWVCLDPEQFLRDQCPEMTFRKSYNYGKTRGFGPVKNLAAQLVHYFGQHLIKNSSIISVQNRGMSQVLRKCNFNGSMLRTVPNIFDTDFYVNPISKKKIIFVGRLEAQKGPLTVLRAFASLDPIMRSDWHLEFYGEGPLKAKINEYINNNEIQNVRVNSCPYEKLPSVYRKASILVHSSKYPEPFSRTWLEAMGSKTALVCSAHPTSRSVLGDIAEFYNPFSVQSLVDSLQTVMNSRNYRRKLQKLGMKKVVEYEPKFISTQYIEIYEELMYEN